MAPFFAIFYAVFNQYQDQDVDFTGCKWGPKGGWFTSLQDVCMFYMLSWNMFYIYIYISNNGHHIVVHITG